MEIKKIDLETLKDLRDECEFLIIQGCGGDLNEWVNGIGDLLKENNIVSDDFIFDEVYTFDNNNLTNLAFSIKGMDLSKLAIFRIKIRNEFGAMWLSDYVDNYLMEISI